VNTVQLKESIKPGTILIVEKDIKIAVSNSSTGNDKEYKNLLYSDKLVVTQFFDVDTKDIILCRECYRVRDVADDIFPSKIKRGLADPVVEFEFIHNSGIMYSTVMTPKFFVSYFRSLEEGDNKNEEKARV